PDPWRCPQSWSCHHLMWMRSPYTDHLTRPQMFLNQLVKRSDDHAALARALASALSLPRDDADAAAKTDALVGYVETIRVGAHPAPGHSNFLLSYFWGLEDHA